MVISSRTPEGHPFRCPICGQAAALDVSLPPGDSICPSCGELLWWFRDRIGAEINSHTAFTTAFGSDSLDLLELVMEVEEKFGVTLADEDAEQVLTVADAIRILRKYLPGEAA